MTTHIPYDGFVGARQTTVADDVVLTGIGVHSGEEASIRISPAGSDTGICFVVTDADGREVEIDADFRAVTDVRLCTVIGDGKAVAVATVEHLLSALRGLGVDNAYVEIDSIEVPIMDGSAALFVEAIDEVGIRSLQQPKRFIRILKAVRVEDGEAFAELAPYDGYKLDVEIDFASGAIGRQRLALDMSPDVFRKQVCKARTFGFMKDVEALWKAGRAIGASLDNTVAVDDQDRVLNPEGLRFDDEFVRHKMLDAVGDLALAGSQIMGAFSSLRGGHRLNYEVLRRLFADKDAWEFVEAPRVRETLTRGETAGAVFAGAAAAYAPNRN
jgi:UDP-3-O-[3-hydroxymyristoyl] N-acetylglucosamine deacetylase